MTRKVHGPADLADFCELPSAFTLPVPSPRLLGRMRDELRTCARRAGLTKAYKLTNDAWPILLCIGIDTLQGRSSRSLALCARQAISHDLLIRYLVVLQSEGLVHTWPAHRDGELKCALSVEAFDKLWALFLPQAAND